MIPTTARMPFGLSFDSIAFEGQMCDVTEGSSDWHGFQLIVDCKITDDNGHAMKICRDKLNAAELVYMSFFYETAIVGAWCQMLSVGEDWIQFSLESKLDLQSGSI